MTPDGPKKKASLTERTVKALANRPKRYLVGFNGVVYASVWVTAKDKNQALRLAEGERDRLGPDDYPDWDGGTVEEEQEISGGEDDP